MTPQIPGLHHVTAITADAQRNLDFYTQVLGLRLVKLTVNFDDPSTYHLYYGDDQGRPGTLWTFCAPLRVRPGQVGASQVNSTTLAVPVGALGFWYDRLAAAGYRVERESRFGSSLLSFQDPDGMRLELMESSAGVSERAGPVPQQFAVRCLDSVTLALREVEPSAAFLVGLGFLREQNEGARLRFRAREGRFACLVDPVRVEEPVRPNYGAGVVHHLAFRTPDDANQIAWVARLTARGHAVSPVMERNYFRSIYFREPGGVLFEIATDAPGFTVDQSLAELGSKLVLPPGLDQRSDKVRSLLRPLRLPADSELSPGSIAKGMAE